jgi:hypothetical protein
MKYYIKDIFPQKVRYHFNYQENSFQFFLKIRNNFSFYSFISDILKSKNHNNFHHLIQN